MPESAQGGMFPYACAYGLNTISYELGGMSTSLKAQGVSDAEKDRMLRGVMRTLELPIADKKAVSLAKYPLATYAMKFRMVRVDQHGRNGRGRSFARTYYRIEIAYFQRYPKVSETSDEDWGPLHRRPRGDPPGIPDPLTGKLLQYPSDEELDAMPEGRAINADEYRDLNRKLRELEKTGGGLGKPGWDAIWGKLQDLQGKCVDGSPGGWSAGE